MTHGVGCLRAIRTWLLILVMSGLAFGSRAAHAQTDPVSDSVGATVGEFRVDEGGNATYSLPIQVPPGTAGVVPKLALSYNSRLASGVMGPGWSLEGASSMCRCRQARENGDFMSGGVPVDGAPAPVNFSSSDRFCLDGVRLLVTAGSYGANGSVYAPENDPFIRVTASVSTVSAGPDTFTVQRKDGTTSVYGNTALSPYSRVTATVNGQTVAVSWNLSRVQDSTGNYIDYLYTNQPAVGTLSLANGAVENVLAEVRYTGHTSNPVSAPYASVRLQYTTLPVAQVHLGYQAGVAFLQSQQITSVTVVDQLDAFPRTLRYYALSYQPSVSGSGVAQLSQIQECRDSSLAVCYPATRFTWSTATNSFIADTPQTPAGPDFKNLAGYKLADIDGDGRQDLVWAKNGDPNCSSRSRIYVSFLDRSNNQMTLITPNQGVVCAPIDLANNDQAWAVLDYDGDGRADLLMGGAAGSRWVLYPSVGRSNGSSVFDTTTNRLAGLATPITVPNGMSARAVLADLNGDGLPDLIYPVTPAANTDFSSVMARLLVRQNNGSLGFSDPYALRFTYTDNHCTGSRNAVVNCDINFFINDPKRSSIIASDSNADGRADLTLLIQASTDTGCSPICTIVSEAQPGFDPTLGDGPVTSAAPANVTLTHYWYQFTAQGISQPNGFAVPVLDLQQYWSQPMAQSGGSLPNSASGMFVVDMNNDGLADLLYQDPFTPTTYRLLLNTGTGYQAPVSVNNVANGTYLQLADITGDGRPELLFPSSASGTFMAVSLQADGTFSAPIPVSGGGMSAGSTLNQWINLTGDLDGDGAADFLRLNVVNSSNNLYASRAAVSSRYRPRDAITAITNGLGATTSISYQPLTNKAIYQRGSENGMPAVTQVTAGWGSPVFDVLAPLYVVSQVSSSAPIRNNPNAQSTVYYRYQGALVQSGGRGSLGFYTVWSFDANDLASTNRTVATVTGYGQEYPFIGMPEVTLHLGFTGAFTRGSAELDACASNSEAAGTNCFAPVGTNPWPDLMQSGTLMHFSGQQPVCSGAGCTAIDTSPCTAVASARSFTSLSVVSGLFTPPAVASPVFSYLSHTVEITTDPDASGAGLANAVNTAQSNSYFCYADGYGNLTHSSTVTQDGDGSVVAQKLLTNTYTNDTGRWYLGRLTHSATQFIRPGQTAITRTSDFTYDATTGLLTSERIQKGTSTDQDLRTVYTFDTFGNRTGAYQCSNDLSDGSCLSSNLNQQSSGTQVHRYAKTTYDNRGRYVTSSVLPFYRAANAAPNEQASVTIQSRDEYGNATQQTSLNGVIQTAHYGALGRPYVSADNTGKTSTTTFRWCTSVSCPSDAVFRQQTQTGGAPTTWTYFDGLGRPILTITQSFDGNANGQSFSGVCGYSDAHNRPVFQSEPFFVNASVGGDDSPSFTTATPCASASYATTTRYDGVGRVIQITQPDNGTVQHSYVGLVTFTTNPRGATWTTTTNALGEVIETRDPEITGDSSLGLIVTNRYDAAGNVVAVSRDGGRGAIVSAITYDVLGRKLQQIDPDAGTLTYAYNAAGDVIRQTDAQGQITTQSYDAVGRRWQRQVTGNDGNTITDTWTYDTATNGYGQLASEARQSSTGVSFGRGVSYDSLGRFSQRSTSIAGSSYSESTSYDNWSRVASQQDASGYALSTQYTPHGYLSFLDDTRTNRLYTIQSLTARGQVSRELRGGLALTTTLGYDPATGRISSVCSGSTCTVQDLQYSFDRVGNLSTRTRNAQHDNPHITQETFTYDALNRLTQSQLTRINGVTPGTPILSATLSYDALGNICSKNGQSYSYAGRAGCPNSGFANSPHAVSAMGNVSYQYDASGNQISSSNGRSLRYNGLNQLAQATVSTLPTSFQYTPEGERFMQTDGNPAASPACTPNEDRIYCDGFETKTAIANTTTLWIGNVEIVRYPNGSTTTKRYLAGVAIDLIRSTGTNEIRYVFADHLGSLDVITTASGGIIETASFDVHGNRRSAENWLSGGSPTATTHRGFTGHEQLDRLGLIHMNGRIYDPALGRMLQVDNYTDGGNQGLNRYSYVINNPLSLTDPSGQSWLSHHWREIVAIGITVWSGGAAAGAWSFFGSSITAGSAASFGIAAGGGFAAGAVQSGNLRGGVYGAFSSALFFGIGSYFVSSNAGWAQAPGGGLTTMGTSAKILAHGVAGGVMGSLQGGGFGHGFLSAGIAEAASPALGHMQNSVSRTLTAAVIGGTTSAISGGKFGNGALTGAFSQAFGEAMQSRRAAPSPGSGSEPSAYPKFMAEANVARAQEVFGVLYANGELSGMGYDFIGGFYGGLDSPALQAHYVDEAMYRASYGYIRAEADIYNYTGISIFRSGADNSALALMTYAHEVMHFDPDFASGWQTGNATIQSQIHLRIQAVESQVYSTAYRNWYKYSSKYGDWP